MWKLERYLLGELPAGEQSQLQQLVADGGVAAERLQALQRSNREILRAYSPGTMAGAIRSRLGSSAGAGARLPGLRNRLQILRRGLAVAGPVAALAVFAILLRGPLASGPQDAGVRAKGLLPALTVYRSVGEGAEQLASGEMVAPADRLQIGYVAAGMGYGLIFSIDGNGVVTVHLPSDGRVAGAAAALETNGEVHLPFSYELDAAPRFERFFFVAAPQPFPVEPVLAVARQLARSQAAADLPLQLGEGFGVADIALLKDGP